MGAPDGDVPQDGAAVCAEEDIASLVKAFDTEMSLVHKPEEDRIQAVRELFLEDARKLRLCERRYVGLSELNARLLKVKQQLESDLDAARQEVAKVDASIARLETLRTTLSAQHEAIVEQGKASLMQQQEQRDRMSGEFNAKIQEISERLTAQGTHGLELAQRNDELKAAIAKELDGLDGEEAEANKLMETTQVALTKLEQGLAGVREEVEEEKRRFDAVEAEAKQALEAQFELRDQIQSHQGRFDGVAARLEEHNAPFEKGREDMNALKKKQKELDRERKALRMRFEKSEKANREAQEKMRRTAQELETVEARKLKLEELQVLLRKDIEGLEERIAGAQQQEAEAVRGTPAQLRCCEPAQRNLVRTAPEDGHDTGRADDAIIRKSVMALRQRPFEMMVLQPYAENLLVPDTDFMTWLERALVAWLRADLMPDYNEVETAVTLDVAHATALGLQLPRSRRVRLTQLIQACVSHAENHGLVNHVEQTMALDDTLRAAVGPEAPNVLWYTQFCVYLAERYLG